MTSATTARRRARVALSIVLVAGLALSVFAGLQHSFVGFIVVAWVAALLYWLPLLAGGMGLELDGERYLTGRTVSGRRTVDLQRLVRVRRFVMPAQSVAFRMVELVDADGVRLVVNERTGNRGVREAVEALLPNAKVVNRGWSYLGGLLCVVPPALIALVLYAVS
ncbi:hypothetical protein [Lentzea sp. NPDC051838]|uniref:hypothetical protein n=1 Tax=Lentzea sp. NPDC051838 TaxID=3154849 RepID=UPI0034308B51